ncbi:MAG: 2-amino-4-hydroxy-6-hydroxymethyldihydropteridine diphosphokinase [Proteobacteria bacterium]|nr:2-amino-4-hydroxy-6-hydroxymethyldihydropteridine diphosphokinase [Pseudomonadota bacterium]
MHYVIGMGSNLAAKGYFSPKKTLVAVVEDLQKRFAVLECAPFYKSQPHPPSGDPWYVNSACLLQSEDSPRQLLEKLMQIEAFWGRVRTVPNAPRTLDLDILAVLEAPEVIQEETEVNPLYIPHPRLHLRSFVLFPMQDILSDWQHPVLNKSLQQMCSELQEPIPAQRMDGS